MNNLPKFTDLLKQATDNGNKSRRREISQEILSEEKSEFQSNINTIFDNAIVNKSTASEIINLLNKIIIDERLEIDPYWIYSQARELFKNSTATIENREFTIRNRIGQRGGFYLSDKTATEETTPPKEEALEKVNEDQEKLEERSRTLEKDFYPLVKEWADENGFDGTEITGGLLPRPKWENPDLVYISYDIGEYTNSIDWEVASFEVKLRVEPYGIWQASNYKKFSTWSYVAFAKNENEVRQQDYGRVFELAVEQGIGVLVLEENNGKIRFREIHSPIRNTPKANELNTVINSFTNKIESVLEKSSKAKKDLATKTLTTLIQ